MEFGIEKLDAQGGSDIAHDTLISGNHYKAPRLVNN